MCGGGGVGGRGEGEKDVHNYGDIYIIYTPFSWK